MHDPPQRARRVVKLGTQLVVPASTFGSGFDPPLRGKGLQVAADCRLRSLEYRAQLVYREFAAIEESEYTRAHLITEYAETLENRGRRVCIHKFEYEDTIVGQLFKGWRVVASDVLARPRPAEGSTAWLTTIPRTATLSTPPRFPSSSRISSA